VSTRYCDGAGGKVLCPTPAQCDLDCAFQTKELEPVWVSLDGKINIALWLISIIMALEILAGLAFLLKETP
jgi:hypothetical protein